GGGSEVLWGGLRAGFFPLALGFGLLAFFGRDALAGLGGGMAAIAASPAFCISSGERSCLCVATLQRWPKGSRTCPYRSPQKASMSGITTFAPAPSARANVASASGT